MNHGVPVEVQVVSSLKYVMVKAWWLLWPVGFMMAALPAGLTMQAYARGRGTRVLWLTIAVGLPVAVVCGVWYNRRNRDTSPARPAFAVQLTADAYQLLSGNARHLDFKEKFLQHGAHIDSDDSEIAIDIDGKRVAVTASERSVTLVCTRTGRLLSMRILERGHEASLPAHGRIRLPFGAATP